MMAVPAPRDKSQLNTVASALVIAASLLLPPGLYGYVAYSNLTADMEGDVRVAAEVVEEFIVQHRQTWRSQTAEVDQLIVRHFQIDQTAPVERIRVFGDRGDLVTVVGAELPAPTIRRSAPIGDPGAYSGRIESERSIRFLFIYMAIFSLVGLALAATLLMTLRIIPLRNVLRSTEALRQRETEVAFANTVLSAVTEGSLDAIITVDEKARVVSYTQRFIDMWRIPREMVDTRDDRPILKLVTSRMKDPAAFLERVKYLYEHPDEESHDRLETADGRIIDRYSRPLHRDGKYYGRVWFFRDITEREQAAEALKQSETRFKAIFDNAHDGIGVLDMQTKTVFTGNPSFSQMLGRTPEEIPGLTLADCHPAEAIPEVARGLARQLRGETNAANDMPLKRKDGSVFFADTTVTPITLDGRPYMLGMFRDVSERKAAEAALKLANSQLRAQIENAPDGILVIDPNRKILLYNHRFVDMWGIPPNAVEAGDDQLAIKSVLGKLKDPEAFVARLDELYAHPNERSRDEEIELKDGRVFERNSGPMPDATGESLGRIWFFRDITERKTAARQIEQRDALLHAVALSAAGLVTASSLDVAIPKALATVSEVLHVDRMVVLERGATPRTAAILRYGWHSPELKAPLDQKYFESPAAMTPEILEWIKPVTAGQKVLSELRSATGDVKTMMETLDIKSMLIVPISVDGKYWGQIGFDSCKTERPWHDFEIEILTTLGDLIGNAIQRDRYVSEISNANRIVQNTPTILYRLRGVPSLPMIYISQNIKLFGYEPAIFTESPLLYQSLVHPDDVAPVREKQAQSMDAEHARGSFEFRLLNSGGEYRWVENRYTQIRDTNGRLVEIEGLLIDITERKAAEEKIARLARTDPLTGLANRTTFTERLQQLFVSARRGGPSFALLYIDLDRFKDINDTLGHPVGDRALVEMAQRLRSCVRDSDLIGRLGGDEFAILEANIENNTDAGTLASKVRKAFAEPLRVDSTTLYMTVSIGISVYSASTTTADDLLSRADIALYRAKEEGRDQFRFHSEALDKQVREQVTLAEELRMAIERAEFCLRYQPQVELSTGEIVGMEALVRWQHPTRGLLAPSAFIDVAERTGSMAAIGQWVLDHACAQMHAWRQHGCAPKTLAVNISAAEIKAGDDFIAFVKATLAKWNLAPKDLELDVTESMLARVTLTQNDAIERLQKFGVRIAIDDFGTKYSSLDYLKTYRVNRLKIPPMLTANAARNPESAAMVRAIVSIARELSIEVVAQGLETESQWSFLTATSPVSKVQGFYFSEPVPPQRAEELLKLGRIKPRAEARSA